VKNGTSFMDTRAALGSGIAGTESTITENRGKASVVMARPFSAIVQNKPIRIKPEVLSP
jgi:hypothetical protein